MAFAYNVAQSVVDPRFWNAKQEKWWDDIFERFANPVVLQKAIDFKFIKNNEDSFTDIIDGCKALGVYELMTSSRTTVLILCANSLPQSISIPVKRSRCLGW